MDDKLDEDAANKQLNEVAKHADKNQRLAWRRKKARIDQLIERLQPLQEERLKLIMQMQPVMDEIEAVRQDMVKECIHPLDHLVHKGSHIECKFCNVKLKINSV